MPVSDHESLKRRKFPFSKFGPIMNGFVGNSPLGETCQGQNFGGIRVRLSTTDYAT